MSSPSAVMCPSLPLSCVHHECVHAALDHICRNKLPLDIVRGAGNVDSALHIILLATIIMT